MKRSLCIVEGQESTDAAVLNRAAVSSFAGHGLHESEATAESIVASKPRDSLILAESVMVSFSCGFSPPPALERNSAINVTGTSDTDVAVSLGQMLGLEICNTILEP